MKRVFYGLVILIVVGIVGVGGGAYWLASMTVDFKDPTLVARFTETYTENCVSQYKRMLTKTGGTPTEEQLTAAGAACKCARDPVIAVLAKRPVMKVSELDGAIRSDPEIVAITKSCSEAAGIANPS